MTTASFDRNEVDRVLLGWLLVWSSVLTLAVASILDGRPSEDLPDDDHFALGVAIGGISAVWTMIGTWIALIHLPHLRDAQSTENATRQRMRPRFGMMLCWLTNVLVFGLIIRQDAKVLTQVLLTVAIGIMGPVIAWQWTHRRIHRGMVRRRKKRSIRQIMGLTLTIALAITLLKIGDRWVGVSNAVAATVVLSAALWLLMMWVILGRWRWPIVVTIPAVIAQGISVMSLVDTESRSVQAQISQLSGSILSFYLFSLILLMLMRSSGHRWGASDDSANRLTPK